MDKFYEFLDGAHAMDKHFESAPLEENMPVILALLGIWNIDFLGAQAQAIIPYDQYLELFPTYLQQLEMESNGKRVCVDGSDVSYKTAPIVWGGVGTNSQHSFHHLLLYANCLAQSQALMCGCGEEDVIAELKLQGMSKEQIHNLMPHKIIPGNVPSNTIVM